MSKKRTQNKNTPKKAQQPVVNQIVIKAPNRRIVDVGEWRNALRSADGGRLSRLFDLYDDLYIDGILSDSVDKRISAVTNSEITFQNAKGEEVDIISDLIDTIDFEEVLTQIMHVRFWGRAAIEFDFSNGFKATELPKKNINLEREMIMLEPDSEEGISYAEDDNILVLGKKRDYGLFLKTAPYAIYKRGGFGDYAQWLELFGMPQRIGKYNSYDTESRELLTQALENAGSAPYVVIPREAEVETVTNTGTGSSGTSYDEFRKACNEEMLITILGQTLTSVQGDTGARALGEVHKEVEEGKNKSDLRFAQRILNQMFLPILERRGYPVAGGRFIFPKSAEPLSVADIVQLSDILEIPAYFLQEKYSIPAAAEDDVIARRVTPTYNDYMPVEEIENRDRSFYTRLRDFFAVAPALTMTGATNRLTLSDSERTKLLTSGSLNDRIIGRIDGKGKFDVELFEFITNDLLKAIGSQPIALSDIGFKYSYQSDAFKTAQELNIFQFSAAKTLKEITELNQIYRDSKSFEEFYKKSSELAGKFNKDWQKTEYNTATNISSANETYNKLMQKKHLFTHWEYRTIDDGRVRESHAELHGIILPVDDRRWDKIYPPNGWNCRCYVVPRMAHEVTDAMVAESRRVVDGYLNSEEWQKVKKQGFGVNRALQPQLFEENKMYIDRFVQNGDKLMRKINYETHKLESVEQSKANATAELSTNKTIEDFEIQLTIEDNKQFLKDYNDRHLQFDFNKKNRAQKPEYLNGLSETMAMPDEVWINGNNSANFNQYTYIKYYNDVTIVATATVRNGKVFKITNWQPFYGDAKKIANRRYGVLVHKRQ